MARSKKIDIEGGRFNAIHYGAAFCLLITALLLYWIVSDASEGPIAATRAISPLIWGFTGGFFWVVGNRARQHGRIGIVILLPLTFGLIGVGIIAGAIHISLTNLVGLPLILFGLVFLGAGYFLSRELRSDLEIGARAWARKPTSLSARGTNDAAEHAEPAAMAETSGPRAWGADR